MNRALTRFSLVWLGLLLSSAAWACPTCIGDAGQDRAALMMSMMVLFVITVLMLTAFGCFFFYLQRRAILYRTEQAKSE